MTATNTHVNTYLKNIYEIHKNLLEIKGTLAPRQSALDKKQDEVLHLIELQNLTAPQRTKAVKRLIEIRKERRAVKQEMIDIDKALSALKFNNLSHYHFETELNFTYSEDLVQEIYGEDE